MSLIEVSIDSKERNQLKDDIQQDCIDRISELESIIKDLVSTKRTLKRKLEQQQQPEAATN